MVSSDIPIYKYKVTWNYANSPFKFVFFTSKTLIETWIPKPGLSTLIN